MTASANRPSRDGQASAQGSSRGKRSHTRRRPRYAGIDLGTNSIRLLVVEIQEDGKMEPILRLGESCRLGEGMDALGSISATAEARTTKSLKNFIRRARILKPRAIGIAATHALRSATNGAQVTERLSRAVGLPVDVLSGEDEARLVYEAVHNALGPQRLSEPCLVLDIGGGSVELVRADGGNVTSWVSLDMGCVRLSERFLSGDPPAPSEMTRLEAHIGEQLERHPEIFEGIVTGAGVGGTLTAMAALDLGLVRYEASRVEGHSLDREAINRWSDQLCALTTRDRSQLPAVGSGRADIIVAGCAILRAVLSHSDLNQLTASTRGLRYAVVHRLASRNGS
jgi:exopolyphosphatase/guanosine-5'-triphosphate,3'-diphosphate pyrophosphatase